MDIWIQEKTVKDGPSHMPSWRKNLCPTALRITQALGGKSRVDGGSGGHGSLPKLGAKKNHHNTCGCYHTIYIVLDYSILCYSKQYINIVV